MVKLEDVTSAAPQARDLTLPAWCHLSLHLFCAVSRREEAVHSAGRNTADSSVNHLQISVTKHLSLTDSLEL